MESNKSGILSFRVTNSERAAIHATGTAIRRNTGLAVLTSDVIRAATRLGLADLAKLTAEVERSNQ
jgi:hypothetical protein